MWPHSYPHICACSCGFFLSLPIPPWKVNEKWAISSITQSEAFFYGPTLFCFPSNKQKQGGQNIDCMQPTALLREEARFVTSNYSQLR